MSELDISLIPVSLIEVIWEQVEPLLDVVADDNPSDVATAKIKEMLMANTNSLVTISEGRNIVAVVTLVINTLDSGMRILYLPVVSGNRMNEWLDDFFDFAHELARNFKCDEIRGMSVRKGWLRTLKEKGWSENHVVLKCKVREG